VSRAEEIFRELQRLARSEGRVSGKPTPTAAYLIRHGLESFLARLAQTEDLNRASIWHPVAARAHAALSVHSPCSGVRGHAMQSVTSA